MPPKKSLPKKDSVGKSVKATGKKTTKKKTPHFSEPEISLDLESALASQSNTNQRHYVNILEELTPEQANRKKLSYVVVVVLSVSIVTFWFWTLKNSFFQVETNNKNQEISQQFNQTIDQIKNTINQTKEGLKNINPATTTNLSSADLEQIKSDIITKIQSNLDSTNWPQHSSDALGLSVQYPTDWLKSELKNELIFNDGDTGSTTAIVDIQKISNTKKIAPEKWLASQNNSAKYFGYQLSSTTIDKIPALTYTSQATDGSLNSVIIITKEKFIYQINLTIQNNKDYYQPILNQIVSTIKFLTTK